MAKVIKILKSSPKKEDCPECQHSQEKQEELIGKNPKDELIEELLGVLMDATPTQVDAYIKGIKRGSSN